MNNKADAKSNCLGLVPPDKAQQAFPDWPFGTWWTRELIRRGPEKGGIGCVRLGRRVFMTRALIDAYLAANTVRP